MEKKKEIYEIRAELVRALAHETRLEIIDILGERGKRCVCELTEALGVSQSSVSKHLGILKQAGIVDSHKEGLNVRYYLRTPCVVNFFTCLDNVLLKDLEKRQEQLMGGSKNK
jgi:DNA-binding transcriptional ArsR family regulator